MKRTVLYKAIAGYLLSLALLPQPAVAAGADKEILYWVAPMDPNYRRDQPGKSPMGMDLVPVYEEEGEEKEPAEVLLYVGCTGAFNKAAQAVPTATARIRWSSAGNSGTRSTPSAGAT